MLFYSKLKKIIKNIFFYNVDDCDDYCDDENDVENDD